MTISYFPRLQLMTVLVAASVLTTLSWAYFSHVLGGIVVTGARNRDANGYYKWEPTKKAYVKSNLKPVESWRARVPNVYDLVSRALEFRRDAGPIFSVKRDNSLISSSADKHKHLYRRAWMLTRSGKLEESIGNSSVAKTPPITGVAAVGSPLFPAARHGPEVRECGRRVAPDLDHLDVLIDEDNERNVGVWEDAAEVIEHPGTVLLLGINFAHVFYIMAKFVSPRAVAVSYSLFWEDREYWRLLTAPFSHFDVIHLIFTTMFIWHSRESERILGTFQYLYQTLDLVVATTMLLMLTKCALIKWGGLESQRERWFFGLSSVSVALATCNDILGDSVLSHCLDTWNIPPLWDLPPLPVTIWPVIRPTLAQLFMRGGSLVGPLCGVLMGHLMGWGFLKGVTTPVLAGVSVFFMLQHSKAWAHGMPNFYSHLQTWCRGDLWRVARARKMGVAFTAHVCVAFAISVLFTWGSAVAEVPALIVGFNALQAFKCCCSPDSLSTEHRYCLTLLKAYGALSAILLVNDLLSLGAILGQPCLLTWLGVSEGLRKGGLVLLVVAAAVHGLTVVACIMGGAVFRDGQAFLSSIGLKQIVTAHSFGPDAETAQGASILPDFIAKSRVASGWFHRGGRTIGSTVRHRPPSANLQRDTCANHRGGEQRREAAGSSGRVARSPARGCGEAVTRADEAETAGPRRKGVENASAPPAEMVV